MQFILNAIRKKWHPLFYLRKNKFWKIALKKFDPDISINISGVNTSIKLLRDLSLVFPHEGLEQNSISHFRKVLKLEAIEAFFDIGANVGIYSWNALDLGIKNIFLFEPDSTNQRLISKTIAKNNFQNSFLFPIALGSKAELSLFLIDNVSGATGTLKKPENQESIQCAYYLSEYRKIPVLSLDTFIDFAVKQKTLIKIDAEGAEDLILEGGKNFIQQVRPHIFIECFNLHTLNKFCEMNYEVYDLNENSNYCLRPK